MPSADVPSLQEPVRQLLWIGMNILHHLGYTVPNPASFFTVGSPIHIINNNQARKFEISLVGLAAVFRIWLLEPQHLTALLSSRNSGAAPARAQHPAPAPWPTSAAADRWDAATSRLRAPSSSGVPWRQRHVRPNLGCPAVGGPIQERDEGRSTRALAIGIILACVYTMYTTWAPNTLVLHGATTHSSWLNNYAVLKPTDPEEPSMQDLRSLQCRVLLWERSGN